MIEPPQRAPKTPMFEALHAGRYHRQEVYREIQRLTGATLIAYVSGPDALIERSDTAYFNDLLYGIPQPVRGVLLGSVRDRKATMMGRRARRVAMRRR